MLCTPSQLARTPVVRLVDLYITDVVFSVLICVQTMGLKRKQEIYDVCVKFGKDARSIRHSFVLKRL